MSVTEEDLSPEERGIYLQASRAVRESDYNLALSLAMPLLVKHPEFFDGRKVLVEATKWKFRDEEFDLHLKASCAVREGDCSQNTPCEPSKEFDDHSFCKPTAKSDLVRDLAVVLLMFAAVAVVDTGVNTHNLFLAVSGILFFALMVCYSSKIALSEKNSRQRIGNKKREHLLEIAQGVCQICGSNSPALFVVNKFPFVEDPNPSGSDEEYVCVCDACRRAVDWLDTTPSPYAIKGNPEPKAA